MLQRGTKRIMEFIGKKRRKKDTRGWSGHFELGHALNYNTQRKHFLLLFLKRPSWPFVFSSEQRMKYWATDNLKQERFVSNVEKSLTGEDIKRRETRQRKKKKKKKISSKEISREVSTHKIEINGLQSKDIKKDL